MTQPETGGSNSEATVSTTQPGTGWGRDIDSVGVIETQLLGGNQLVVPDTYKG